MKIIPGLVGCLYAMQAAIGWAVSMRQTKGLKGEALVFHCERTLPGLWGFSPDDKRPCP